MPEEGDQDAQPLSTDLSAVKRRIAEIVSLLENFGTRRDPRRSRSDYLQQLKQDCMLYYGYNAFMIDALFNLFAPAGAHKSSTKSLFCFFCAQSAGCHLTCAECVVSRGTVMRALTTAVRFHKCVE